MLRNASENTIRVNPKNPHYFQYKGKDILLITAAEVYGAVVNKKFNYKVYLDTLNEYGFNYTRIYPGAFVAKNDMFGGKLTLAPEGDLIVPWARSNESGYIGGGNKFDLTKWDPEFFQRLNDFLGYAASKDVIVEICFFNAQYPHCMEYSPLHKNSNIQGIGSCDDKVYQYKDDQGLFDVQLKYVEKIIVETNMFDNVIYEFIDEPTLYLSIASRAYNWISSLVDKAIETEDSLPKKHLLAQQLEFGVDFCDDDRVAVITTQYIEANARQVGGILALNNAYCYEKPIEMNETAFVNIWYNTDLVPTTRLEAWEFMIAGGAAINQLNGFFTVDNPTGNDRINKTVFMQLKNLRTFMESLDYISMRRDRETIKRVTGAVNIHAISEKGKQYAMYMHHSHLNYGEFTETYYIPNRGVFEDVITAIIEKGSYKVTFIEPETLKVIEERPLVCDGGETEIKCPQYTLDIAIKIITD